jgi:predicted Zn finger-like uncharacterized protein
MPIRVRCSQCQTLFNVADEKIGKLIRCSKCQTVFRAEAPTEAVQEVERVEPIPELATVTPAPQPSAEVVAVEPVKAKKRSKVPVVLGGCAAVLFLMLAACGVTGYIFYVKISEFVTTVKNDLAQFNGKPNDSQNAQDKTPGDKDKVDNTQKPGDKKPDDKKPDDGRAYTLKIKSQPGAGKATRVTSTQTLKGEVKEVIDTRVQMRPINKKLEDVHTCVVVEAGEPRPRRFKEVYEKATSPEQFRPILPYEGRTITYGLQVDSYYVTLSGEFPIPKKDLDALARHARGGYLDAALLPGKPVRVGDTWTPDAKALSERYFNNLEINTADSKASAKLDKVIEKAGKQMAVVGLDLRLAVVQTVWLPFAATDASGTIDLHGTQEFPLDGSDTTCSVSLAGKLELHYTDVALMRAMSDLSAELTLTEERAPETDAAKELLVVADPAWQTYTSPPGRYTAEFPGKPKASGSKTIGKAEFTDDKGTVYSVNYADYSGAFPAPTTRDELLKHVAAGNEKKVMDRKDIMLGDGFGIEFTVELSFFNTEKKVSEPYLVHERAYLVNGRRYEIKVQSLKGAEPTEADVKRFLESLKVP